MGAMVDIFRSQLILDEQKFLFDVWQQAALENKMPTRQEFSPCAFGPLLPFVSLIEINNEDATMRVRVVGSNLRDVFNGDPKEILLAPEIEGSLNTIQSIIESKEPLCGIVDKEGAEEIISPRFWLRLPLGHNETVTSIIGLDITRNGARVPLWAMKRMNV